MKNTKTFVLQASRLQARLLSEALNVYAHAAYPPGGSECTQVSHQALQESARQLLLQAEQGQAAALRRRQRALMKAAVQWYFSDQGPGDASLCDELLGLFP